MHRKIILLTILSSILIILAAGFIVWQKFSPKNPPVSTPNPSPEPQYPQTTSYQIPILMYHYIRNAEGESELGKNLSVSPQNFEAQIKWLKDDGYETIRLADLADPDKKAISKIIYEKKKPIIFTFDDGYADAYTAAFPTLKKYNMSGTFFIIRNYVGKSAYMDQTQINEMEKAGMEIGSHTLSHPDLTKININDAQGQIFDSKQNALTFCYPAGKFNDTTVNLVKDAGYLAAVTTKIGIASEKSNLFQLPRVRVEDTSAQVLKDKIDYAFTQ